MIPEDDRKRALEDLEIPEEIYDELIDDFIEMANEEMGKIRTLLEADNNLDHIKKLAHSIKGAAANLRLEPSRIIAAAMELDSPSYDDIKIKMTELEKEVEILKQ